MRSRLVLLSCAVLRWACRRSPTFRARRRSRRRQGKGRAVHRLSRRQRHLADREHPFAGGTAGSVHPVAAGLLPHRRAQERTDAADRRADQQRGHPQSRRLFRLADAAQDAGIGRRSGSVEEGRAGRGGPALRRLPHRYHSPAPRRWRVSPASARNICVKALHDYKSGVRSGGAGAAMADVAYPLSEEEITALAHYLAHLTYLNANAAFEDGRVQPRCLPALHRP